MSKPKVLFLSTENASRGQMAEGWLRYLAGDQYEAMSAGTHPGSLNSLAIAAMQEVGIDISTQEAKSVERFTGQAIEYVITVCDRAKEECPYVPSLFQVFSWAIDDPTEAKGGTEERMTSFRRVRDELRDRIENEFLCLCKFEED